MKTEWDYTDLAEAYLKRPDYSDSAIDQMIANAGLQSGDRVCDVGAGVAHLTLKLAERGFQVVSVEPNDAMRGLGTHRTAEFEQVSWFEGTGEQTGQPDNAFAMITYGSSFNVMDRALALKEAQRIVQPQGWFAAMWNHRHLDDPIQADIEGIINEAIPGYGYGTRREDQTDFLRDSGYFSEIQRIEGQVFHRQSIPDVVEAWRSHATLHRQAGEAFPVIIERIERLLHQLGSPDIVVPYTTRLWLARFAA